MYIIRKEKFKEHIEHFTCSVVSHVLFCVYCNVLYSVCNVVCNVFGMYCIVLTVLYLCMAMKYLYYTSWK